MPFHERFTKSDSVKLKEVEIKTEYAKVSLKWTMHIEILKSTKASDCFLKIIFPLKSLKDN